MPLRRRYRLVSFRHRLWRFRLGRLYVETLRLQRFPVGSALDGDASGISRGSLSGPCWWSHRCCASAPDRWRRRLDRCFALCRFDWQRSGRCFAAWHGRRAAPRRAAGRRPRSARPCGEFSVRLLRLAEPTSQAGDTSLRSSASLRRRPPSQGGGYAGAKRDHQTGEGERTSFAE
jgi:hypothetical protein